ncbi:MAG TPA: hypothetical protein VJ890_20760 [Vineibacter sp.]|nr:hypothetical protein [Vineibacter sp.]
MSDDGLTGLVIIAFVGSVFSPYYARARRRNAGNPLDHCAVNVALYSNGSKRWTMTERRQSSLHRSADVLAIGPSCLSWNGDSLHISISETAVPVPSSLRGAVRVFPAAIANHTVVLKSEGRHVWRPIAPTARVEVVLQSPALDWSGTGYVDTNHGDAPLETAFSDWSWSRAAMGGEAAVLYDVRLRHGAPVSLALRFDRHGRAHDFAPPPLVRLPTTKWQVPRSTRADDGHVAKVLRTLEDAPFYARTAISTRLLGMPTVAVHESLSLNRFSREWVQMLLPFRMPRAWR